MNHLEISNPIGEIENKSFRLFVAKIAIFCIFFTQFYYPTLKDANELGLSIPSLIIFFARLDVSIPFLSFLILPELILMVYNNNRLKSYTAIYGFSIIFLILTSTVAYFVSIKNPLIESLSFGKATLHYITSLLIFLTFGWYFLQVKDINKIFKYFLTLSFFSSIWCIKPVLFPGSINFGLLTVDDFHLESDTNSLTSYLYGFGLRYQGFTSSPTQQAILSMCGWIIALVFLKYQGKTNSILKKLYLIVIVIITTVAVFLSQTRTYIFIMPFLLIFIFFNFKSFSFRQIFFVILSFLVVGSFLVYFFRNPSGDISIDRVSNLDGDRLEIAKYFIMATASDIRSFFLGNGFLYYYIHPLFRPDGELLNAHTVSVDLISSFGFIFGIFLLLWFFYLNIKVYKKNIETNDINRKVIIHCMVIFYFVSTLITGTLYPDDFSGILWALIFYSSFFVNNSVVYNN